MYRALISGQIYRNDDGTTDIEIFNKIHNDNTDIFDDVDHALLEQIEPNFEHGECYFFIASVESKIVAYTHWEGTDYEVEHEITELKSFEDLPKGIVSNEPPSSVATAADKGILTEEELNHCYKLVGKGDTVGLCEFADKFAIRVLDQVRGYASILSANAELSFYKNKYKEALNSIINGNWSSRLSREQLEIWQTDRINPRQIALEALEELK